MRIAFVTPRFHPCKGGYENYVAALACGLARTGEQVSVFTTNSLDLEHFWLPNREHLEPGSEIYEGVEVHRFAVSHQVWKRRALRLLGLVPYWRWQAQYRRPSFQVLMLAESIERFRPDVIHIGPLPYTALMYAGVQAAEGTGAILVSTPCTHFGVESSREISRHYTQEFQIHILNKCRYVFALTKVEATRLFEFGVQPEKIKATGIGVDFAKVTGGDGRRFRQRFRIAGPIILHMGMKAPEKGTFAVLQAMKRLWEKGSNATLVLAGPELSSVTAYMSKQKFPENLLLNFLPVNESKKLDLLAAADVVVQPSAVESFGLIYLEAWANAKPIVAADIAVTREVISDGGDGLLVTFGNASELEMAINQLLQNPEMAKKMGEAGREKVIGNFAWEARFQRLKSFIVGSPS